MRTGIFISGRTATEGGGYTITYDILNNLINKINKNNNDSFYFILVNDNDNFIKKKLIENKIFKKFQEFNFYFFSIYSSFSSFF